MEVKELLPYVVAILTGISSWIGSYFMSTKKFKQDMSTLKEQNKYDLERLMNQHKLDLEALKEKHNMEMKLKDKEHGHQLEIMQKQHDNELIRKEKELEDTVKYDAMGGLFSNIMNTAMNNPKIQNQIEKEITKAFNQKGR